MIITAFDELLKETRGDLARMNDSTKQFIMNLLSKKRRSLGESHTAHEHVNGRADIETTTLSDWKAMAEVRNQFTSFLERSRKALVHGWHLLENNMSTDEV